MDALLDGVVAYYKGRLVGVVLPDEDWHTLGRACVCSMQVHTVGNVCVCVCVWVSVCVCHIIHAEWVSL